MGEAQRLSDESLAAMIKELLSTIGQVSLNAVIPDDPRQMRYNARVICSLIRESLEELENLIGEDK